MAEGVNDAAIDRRSAMKDFLGNDESSEKEEVVVSDEGDNTEDDDTVVVVDDESGDQDDSQSDDEAADDDEEGSEEGEEDDEESKDGEDEDDSEEAAAEIPEDVQYRADAMQQLIDALDNTAYPLTGDPDTMVEEIGARLTDANYFYRVIDGSGTVDDLFARLEHFQGKEVKDATLVKILEYAKSQGLIEGGDEEDETEITDPVAKENARLKKELAELKRPKPVVDREQRGIQIFNAAKAELKRLSDESKLDDWTFENVLLPALGKGVGGNQAIINRIARGNFVDIVRIFTESKNRLVGLRVKRGNAVVAKKKIRDQKVPKTVNGAGKPAAAETVDFASKEGRTSAAKRLLRG